MTQKERSEIASAHFLDSAGLGCVLLDYSRGSVIFSQDSLADSVFYIRDGKIKLTVTSSGGKEAVIALLGRGEFFGHACLAGEIRRMATAIGLTDCSLTRIDKESIAALLKTDPGFSSFFLQRMLKRSIRADEDLVDQLFNPSEKRLARALLLLANYCSDTPIEPSILKISQETLAEMIGTTRSRVSFFMNKFRRLGYINYNTQLEVRPSLLNILVDEPAVSIRGATSAIEALPAISPPRQSAGPSLRARR